MLWEVLETGWQFVTICAIYVQNTLAKALGLDSLKLNIKYIKLPVNTISTVMFSYCQHRWNK